MKNLLDELKTECAGEAGCFGTCLENEAKDVVTGLKQGLNNAKTAVCAKMEDGTIAAERLLKHCRHTAEDGVSEAAYRVKKQPFRFLAIAFAVGAVVGFASARAAKK